MKLLSKTWAFLSPRKKYWLLPLIVVLVLFGGLVIMARQNAVGAFVYTF